MNVLFLATYGDFLATFEYSNITIWQELGCTVHCASNFSNKLYNLKTDRLDKIGVVRHEIVFSRSPFNKDNIIAYKQLNELLKYEKIDVIDCHNAIVSVFARMAAEKCHIKKVVYTPHSFFFYKGCSLKNRIIFETVEKIFSKKTDLLITINKEDFQATKRMKVRGKSIYVPGIGLDISEINVLQTDKARYCKEFQIPKDSFVMLSVGELNDNKNHRTAIEAFSQANIPNAVYLICGLGDNRESLENQIEQLGMKDKIKLVGYRNDVKNIMKMSDVFIFPSFREGLSVALMEAMACGLICIVSKIRGNTDLIDDELGGYLFPPDDVESLAYCICRSYLLDNSGKAREYNQRKVQTFDINNVQRIMRREYKNLLGMAE